jgi:hypothetical protein
MTQFQRYLSGLRSSLIFQYSDQNGFSLNRKFRLKHLNKVWFSQFKLRLK